MRDAVEALRRGDELEALPRLLDAWRRHRDPRLADLIERLSARLNATQAPVGRKRPDWLALASQQRPESLLRLLAALPDDGGPAAAERLEFLLTWPEDPRLASAVMAWLEAPPFSKLVRAQVIPRAIALLARQEDRRIGPRVDGWTRPDSRKDTVSRLGSHAWTPLKELAATVSGWSQSALSAEDEALLTELDGFLAAPPAGSTGLLPELFAAVYADATDDAPRLVLADALQAAGDPRGEFIALQLSRGDGPASAQEKSLLKKWSSEWLGSLEPKVLRENLEFRRGFVSRAKLKNYEQVSPSQTPECLTLESIEFSPSTSLDENEPSIFEERWTGLREVLGLSWRDLPRAIQRGPWPWTSLGLRLDPHYQVSPTTLEALRSLHAFPGLHKLSLHAERSSTLSGWNAILVRNILDAPRAPKIKVFEASLNPQEIPAMVALAAERGFERLWLGLDEQLNSWSIEYTPATRRLSVRDYQSRRHQALRESLLLMSPELVQHLTIALRHAPNDVENVTSLAELSRRFTVERVPSKFWFEG